MSEPSAYAGVPARASRRSRQAHGATPRQSWASSAVISLTADLASPNSIEVFGSK
jgi:hypothetical protein